MQSANVQNQFLMQNYFIEKVADPFYTKYPDSYK